MKTRTFELNWSEVGYYFTATFKSRVPRSQIWNGLLIRASVSALHAGHHAILPESELLPLGMASQRPDRARKDPLSELPNEGGDQIKPVQNYPEKSGYARYGKVRYAHEALVTCC